ALMDVFMASRAREIFVMEGRRGFRESRLRRVAVRTGHRDVPALERKPRRLVLGQRERRGRKGLDRVATFAIVVQRRSHKLSVVLVLVAVRAQRGLDLVLRLRSRPDVGPGALYLRMRALQGIVAAGVVLHREGGRLPSTHGVAGFALVAVLALGELPAVRIGLMAIRA